MLRVAVVVGGLAGLGLIGGAAHVVHSNNGIATVTNAKTGDSTVAIKNDKTGKSQTVTLPDDGGGRATCRWDTLDELDAYAITLDRIKLKVQQVRGQMRQMELKYPSDTAPDAVVERYKALWRLEQRLVDAFNSQNDDRNAVIDRDCTPAG